MKMVVAMERETKLKRKDKLILWKERQRRDAETFDNYSQNAR
jgi:hypothetical protein